MRVVFKDGREYPAKNLRNARLDAIIELQLQSGFKIPQLNERIKASEIFGGSVLYFLSVWGTDSKVSWKTLMAAEHGDLPAIVPDPGDLEAIKEAQGQADDADPQTPAAGDATPDAGDPSSPASTDNEQTPTSNGSSSGSPG